MDALGACNRMNQQTQDMFVRRHALLVKRIASYLFARLPHTMQFDDLIQAGMLGLLEALKYYDASKGASFETYATIRIRGYMLDELRRNDWVPRSVYRNARMISAAVKKVENRMGRDAKDHEIANELQLSLKEYHDILKDSTSNQVYGFDDLGVSDDVLALEGGNESTEPHVHVQKQNMIDHLRSIMKKLPEKERLVLSLYYDLDLNLKEIGAVLGVSESRVCQIHNQATLRIRSKFETSK